MSHLGYTRRWPARPLSLLLALAACLAGALLAPAAHAAVAAPERVQAISPVNSSAKGVNSTCPAGKRALGVGGRIVTSTGQVVMDDLAPNAGLTGATAFGAEDGNGYPENWLVISEAICATPPAGLQLVTASSPTNSSSKGVTATCPTGKRVLGTGADLAGGLGQVILDDIAPNAGLTAVTAFGVEDGNGHSGNWTLRAFAVCATPPAGLQRVAATSASNSAGSGKSITATCPTGKDLLGLGHELTGAGGQVTPNELNPAEDLGSVSVFAYEDEDGQAANWSLSAYAICANGSRRVVEQSANDSSSPKTAGPDCPAGKQSTGAGGDISGGFGQVILDDLIPFAGASVHAEEDGTGTTSNWLLRGYAICATPPPGREVVSSTTDLDSSFFKSAFAVCPVGKRVIGAGADIDDGAGQVMLDDITPSADLTSVSVVGVEDGDGYSGNWQVTAYAVCANAPPGLQLVAANSVEDEDDIKSVTARCPDGKNVVGTGGEFTGGVGRVSIDDLRPDAALTSVTVTGVETEFGQVDWDARAYAICANP